MKKKLSLVLAGAMLALTALTLLGLAAQPYLCTRLSAGPRQLALGTGQIYQLSQPETTQSARPVYRIPEGQGAAPAPDPAKYGQAKSPEELIPILEQAQPLLEGQSLYFSPERELFPGSTIGYYLDQSILAIVWKEQVEKTAFTFAEIKLLHPSQFRRYLSGGTFGSGRLALTSEMSREVNAVVGCSADYYSYRRRGLTIQDGKVEKFVKGLEDTCYIDCQGDLILEREQGFETIQQVQAYADANDIRFSLSFGPILVKDGENICPIAYPLGEVTQRYSRAALCQMDKLHYLYIAAGTDQGAYGLMSMRTFAKHVAATGCRQAYALDGGQTTTVVLDNQVFNNVNYGSERRISDIIYFATAVPEGG